jgi:uncharacterized protein (TIGR02246 family)
MAGSVDQQALDRLAIQDLLARYGHATDAHDAQAASEMFSADGVFVNGEMELCGRERILEFFSTWHLDPSFAAIANGRHFFSPPQITVSGDRAQASSSMLFVIPTADGLTIASLSTYVDELEKEGEEWLFRSRSVQVVEG